MSGAEAGRPAAPGATVKVRLAGTRGGCAEAARRLHAVFYVTCGIGAVPGGGQLPPGEGLHQGPARPASGAAARGQPGTGRCTVSAPTEALGLVPN